MDLLSVISSKRGMGFESAREAIVKGKPHATALLHKYSAKGYKEGLDIVHKYQSSLDNSSRSRTDMRDRLKPERRAPTILAATRKEALARLRLANRCEGASYSIRSLNHDLKTMNPKKDRDISTSTKATKGAVVGGHPFVVTASNHSSPRSSYAGGDMKLLQTLPRQTPARHYICGIPQPEKRSKVSQGELVEKSHTNQLQVLPNKRIPITTSRTSKGPQRNARGVGSPRILAEIDEESDASEEDWRAELRKVTRYNPSCYDDADLECEESTFSRINVEEKYSKKIGDKEDEAELALLLKENSKNMRRSRKANNEKRR